MKAMLEWQKRRAVYRVRRLLRSADASHWIPDQVGNDDVGGVSVAANQRN